MAFGSIVFTTRGKVLQSKAQAGTKLNFTKLAIGDGELGSQSVLELTELKNKKLDIPISALKVLTGGIASVGGTFTNENIDTGFYWREVGLYATDPDIGEILYVYGNAGALAEYIPSSGGSEILEKFVAIEAIIGNANNVSATINQSLVYATIEDIETHNSDPKAHPELSQQIKNLESQIEGLDTSWDGITGKPQTFPPAPHGHTKEEITDFPSSLPANGGDADTVDGKHASDFASSTHNHDSTYASKQGVYSDIVSGGIKASDTRNVQYTPEWYMTNKPMSTVTEFKSTAAIGITGTGSTHCYLETHTPWNDSSGGYPMQIAWFDTRAPLYRCGISDDAWSEWKGLGGGNTLRSKYHYVSWGTNQTLNILSISGCGMVQWVPIGLSNSGLFKVWVDDELIINDKSAGDIMSGTISSSKQSAQGCIFRFKKSITIQHVSTSSGDWSATSSFIYSIE